MICANCYYRVMRHTESGADWILELPAFALTLASEGRRSSLSAHKADSTVRVIPSPPISSVFSVFSVVQVIQSISPINSSTYQPSTNHSPKTAQSHQSFPQHHGISSSAQAHCAETNDRSVLRQFCGRLQLPPRGHCDAESDAHIPDGI